MFNFIKQLSEFIKIAIILIMGTSITKALSIVISFMSMYLSNITLFVLFFTICTLLFVLDIGNDKRLILLEENNFNKLVYENRNKILDIYYLWNFQRNFLLIWKNK